ncbi:hypothetical protein GGE68_004900 [Rhizobium leguminosarum]|uniref:hypothetical protein n=1 Tax=Rhizobium leguminosarum TaxID=384 RepID=UPI00160F9CED|nr:hypothetical protein [Rhizobium leguminosarum]MBB5666668.1 hypothetical protein [Rhizobium leguminosarum]
MIALAYPLKTRAETKVWYTLFVNQAQFFVMLQSCGTPNLSEHSLPVAGMQGVSECNQWFTGVSEHY